MIKHTFFILLLGTALHFSSFGQNPQKPHPISVSLTYGSASFFPTKSEQSKNHLINTNSNPILNTVPRYVAVGCEVALNKHLIVALNIGANPIIGSITIRDTSLSIGKDVELKLNHAFFFEPELSWEFFIDSSFSLIPGVGVSLYYQKPNSDVEAYMMDTRWNASINSLHNFYTTLNPKLEFRSKPTKHLQLGFLVKYAFGLNEVMTLSGRVSDEASALSYRTSYNASHLLLSIRAGWAFY